MTDLFQSAHDRNRTKPLAADLRPESLDEIIGQRHLLGSNTLLRRRIASGRIGSIILYGPSGIGKTTIARAIGNTMNKKFRMLHPAQHQVKDIRDLASEARGTDILVFVDEVHRFNAGQQDSLLALTEDGVFDMIAATTGNPYHVLTPALVSRSTILQLKPLDVDEMSEVVKRAIRKLQERNIHIKIAPDVLKSLAGRASGDARRALNAIEDIVIGQDDNEITIDQAAVDEVYNASPIPYDRNGDAHYDVTSAWIKSMRGSDADASIYWLARLIASGEDPRYIARRLLIHASEDVGLADNTALATAAAALQAVQHIGYPEAQIVLSHATLHIALAPKSNSACRAIGQALEYVRSQPAIPVPSHLRDGHYAGAQKLGHVGYQFPHDNPNGWIPQEYAPGINPGDFYQSDGRSGATFEQRAEDFWNAVKGNPTPRTFPKE